MLRTVSGLTKITDWLSNNNTYFPNTETNTDVTRDQWSVRYRCYNILTAKLRGSFRILKGFLFQMWIPPSYRPGPTCLSVSQTHNLLPDSDFHFSSDSVTNPEHVMFVTWCLVLCVSYGLNASYPEDGISRFLRNFTILVWIALCHITQYRCPHLYLHVTQLCEIIQETEY